MRLLRRQRTSPTELDFQSLPAGPGVLAVYYPEGSTDLQLAGELGTMAPQLADELHRVGRTDVIIVVVPGEAGLESLDADDMARHGWVRRQDRQTGG